MIQTIIVSSLDEKLLKEWEALWHASPEANFVNAPYWFLSVIDTFQYSDYRIVAVYKDKRLLGIVGLIKEKIGGIDCFTVPPGDFVCGTPILGDINDKEFVEALIKKLLLLGPVFFDNVSIALNESLRKVTSSISAAPFSINLYLDFEKDENGQVIVPKKKRMLREAKAVENKFSFKSIEGNSANKFFDTAFLIDAKSRKHLRGYNAFSDDTIQQFYKSLAKHFQKNVLLNFLYFEDHPVVYEMGFLIGQTYYGSQIAFDDHYRQYAPGKVFEVKLIEHLFSKGVKRIDYGSGDNFIKRTLANGQQPLFKLILSKNPFIRLYINMMYQSKDVLFTLLTKNPQVYSVYRSIKKVFQQ